MLTGRSEGDVIGVIAAEAMPEIHCFCFCASHIALKKICVIGPKTVLQKVRQQSLFRGQPI